jgi:hypothetical protein
VGGGIGEEITMRQVVIIGGEGFERAVGVVVTGHLQRARITPRRGARAGRGTTGEEHGRQQGHEGGGDRGGHLRGGVGPRGELMMREAGKAGRADTQSRFSRERTPARTAPVHDEIIAPRRLVGSRRPHGFAEPLSASGPEINPFREQDASPPAMEIGE